MAKLKAAERNALPSSEFAEPGKRAFPINDKAHAEAAIKMSGHRPPAEAERIKAKARAKFPDVFKSGMRT